MKLKLCSALLTAATLFVPLSSVAEQTQNPADAKRAAVAAYGKLPLSFEATNSSSSFVAHSGSYMVSVGASESSVAIADTKPGKSQLLRFSFKDANSSAPMEAMEALPGVTNYYLGQDSSKWRLGVKDYAKVRAQSVYPGVDVVYYGDHRRLEFDFVVAPKADPSAIALSFSGADKLYVDAKGDLVAEVGGQSVSFAKPNAYQKVAGGTKPVEASYELAADSVHLHLGSYDPSSELIIDPVVSYATYLGGVSTDTGNGIAVDSTGAAYITGMTASPSFPLGAATPNLVGTEDAFVTKLSADGTTVVYTTILGGTAPTPSNGTAIGYAIALDASKFAYITGQTNFTDLPGNVGYGNGMNTYQGGDSDAFIVILDNNGTLVRSSYLGGTAADIGYGIAVDTSLNVIVVGQTCSTGGPWGSGNFPGYNSFEPAIEACVAFVTKLDNLLHIRQNTTPASAMTPSALGGVYFFSDFYGGLPVAPTATAVWIQGTTYPKYAIVEDTLTPPNIQIAMNSGTSQSSTPPAAPITAIAWNSSLNGITPDGSISWVNLGPANVRPTQAVTRANGVALDPHGDVFVAGGTDTANLGDFVGWIGPFSHYVGTGAWVLKVSGVDGSYIYGAALENTKSDVSATIDAARAIAVDTSGRAYVTGTTTGTLLTTASSFAPANAGGEDAFVLRMNTAGSAIEYGTYLGGSGNDQGLGIATDTSGAAYVTGSTQSLNFPTINPLVNPNSTPNKNSPILALSGQQNAFISKFNTDGTAIIFSAYLGGAGTDSGNAIATDTANAGNMYVTGTTSSNDFEQNLVDTSSYTAPQTTYAGGGDAFVAMVSGSSLPTVTVAPGGLSFGLQSVGSPTAASPITYKNTTSTSNSTVSITSITFTGTNGGDFQQAFPGPATQGAPGDCVPGTIAAGASCNINVYFNPTAGGLRTGTLTIVDDYSTTPHRVTLAGTGAVPLDSFNPTTYAFTSAGSTSITLKNTGAGTLNVGSIAIGGTNATDFTLTGNTCGSTVVSAASCTLTVKFNPTETGTLSANLTVTDNSPGSPHLIPLTGPGIAAPVAGATISGPATAVTFSSAVGSSNVQNIIVTNSSASVAVIVSGATLSGANAAEFAITANNCAGTSIAAGATCTIVVTFTPSAAGTASASLNVLANATNSPLVISLSGTGSASTTPTATAFTLTPAASGIPVVAGATATFSIAVAPVNNNQSTINFTCSGPALSTCSVSPKQMTMNGSTQQLTLSVGTTSGATARATRPYLGTRSLFFALLPFSMMGLLLITKRRGVWLVLCLLALCVAMGMVGCGSSSSSKTGTSSGTGLAPGSYQIVVTGTTTDTVPVTNSVTVIVAVSAS